MIAAVAKADVVTRTSTVFTGMIDELDYVLSQRWDTEWTVQAVLFFTGVTVSGKK